MLIKSHFILTDLGDLIKMILTELDNELVNQKINLMFKPFKLGNKNLALLLYKLRLFMSASEKVPYMAKQVSRLSCK